MLLDSEVYIAISDNEIDLTQKDLEVIDITFKEEFEDDVRLVSNVEEGGVVEVVYGIQVPMIEEDEIQIYFLERLFMIMKKFEVYNPHFTHIEEGDFNEQY